MRKITIIKCCCYADDGNAGSVKSPNGNIELKFQRLKTGRPVYEMTYKGKDVVKPSFLGLELARDKHASMGLQEHDLMDGFTIAKEETSTFDETWQPVWGETKDIRNHYNELAVTLMQQWRQPSTPVRTPSGAPHTDRSLSVSASMTMVSVSVMSSHSSQI